MHEKVTPRSTQHLAEIITAHIQQYGPACDLNHIDVSGITDFTRVFTMSLNTTFVGDISKWDVSNAASMVQMFERCAFNGDISQWDVSNVKTMSKMFGASKFNGDISNWDTRNVQTMDFMFQHSIFNRDISLWNVGQVTTMFGMFLGAKFNQDISGWNVSTCKDFTQMFLAAFAFDQDISNWPIAMDARLPSMFDEAHLLSVQGPILAHWQSFFNRTPPALPPEWVAHAMATKEIALHMGLQPHEAMHWMHKTWKEKHHPLALPDGLGVDMQ